MIEENIPYLSLSVNNHWQWSDQQRANKTIAHLQTLKHKFEEKNKEQEKKKKLWPTTLYLNQSKLKDFFLHTMKQTN